MTSCILCSVIDHVKDQNWTAVVVDFFIGVVIGIEVTNWNDQRKARDDLAASLRNLAQEVSNILWHRDDQIQWGERKKDGFTLMLEAAEESSK